MLRRPLVPLKSLLFVIHSWLLSPRRCRQWGSDTGPQASAPSQLDDGSRRRSSPRAGSLHFDSTSWSAAALAPPAMPPRDVAVSKPFVRARLDAGSVRAVRTML